MAEDTTQDEIKVGARNSAADMSRIQAAHDAMADLGAVCRTRPDVTEMPLPSMMTADPETLIHYGHEVKALGDGRVGGYLVRFSTDKDPDLTGDFFTKDTDFGQHTKSAVFYQHALDLKLGGRVIGEGTLKPDEIGIWIESQLEQRDEYEKAVYDMAQAGKLGWSSGTASHLVEREPVGKSYKITKWPLGLDASLTPTPAEPRNTVIPLKALFPSVPTSDSQPSQEAGAAGDAALNGAAEAKPEQPQPISNEVTTMEPTEIQAIAEAAANQAVKAYVAANPPASPAGYVEVVADEADRDPKPYKSFGEQLQAIKAAALNPSAVDKRLLALNAREAKSNGANEALGADGGFAVQNDFAHETLNRVYSTGEVLSRVSQREIGANSNGLTINVINETDRATGSRFGAVRAYWLNEGGTLTGSRPKYRKWSLNLEKLIGLYVATDELLQDATALGGEVSEAFAMELQFAAEDSIIEGSGAGLPLGVLNSAATVSVAKETGQAAATIVAKNINKMWSRMWAPDRSNAVWFVNQDVEPQLEELALTIGTGGAPLYMPAGGIADAPLARLKGRPVIPVEYCPTLGTVGDIILANMNNYRWIKKGGVQQASSIHLYFTTDESAFRWTWRVNGAPFDVAPLTPFKGSNTLAHFVTLATR